MGVLIKLGSKLGKAAIRGAAGLAGWEFGERWFR